MALEPADAGDQHVGEPAFALQHLRAGFLADDGLKIAHHHRIRMRPRGRADDVERVVDVGDPIAQGFVHRIFQRARAGTDRANFGAQQIHAEHVRLLPLDVHFAHIDEARKTEKGRNRRGGDAVLPAPVSAMMRVLPMRLARRICPRQLLILCAPV